MTKKDTAGLKEMRKKMFLTAYAGGMAHLASAFSAAEIFYALYQKGILKIDAAEPWDEDRDRLILSKGHASLALYVSLAMKGLIEEEELYTFIQPGSRLSGEPCMNGIPGVEAATGSLGHGLSLGVGMALAGKIDRRNNMVYVVLGDGECEEGSIWEAVMSANKYGLGNLTVILDCNKIQKMGFIEETMKISSWRSKWESFGWIVDEIEDGNDLDQVCEVLCRKTDSNIPRLVLANTVKGKGISIMENNPNWHFKMPNKKELKVFMAELEITEEELERCRKHI